MRVATFYLTLAIFSLAATGSSGRELSKEQFFAPLVEAPAAPTLDMAELIQAEYSPPKHLIRLIRRLSKTHGLDPDLVTAVVGVESRFRTDAVSPRNARGLMQLTDVTAGIYGVKDPYDPASNLQGGIRHLKALLRNFDGDVRLALAAYNAGESAVRRHGGIPPYRETRAYVERVLRFYRHEHHPVGSPAGVVQTAERAG